MNVLSLFDGMSVGRLALERAGIEVTNYYASEVNPYAIEVSRKNYPDIIQLGDVTKWREWDLPEIDLVIGGSPCQAFSFGGKQLNFEDPRGKLFFEFADVLNHIKPKYFLLENVSMKKEYEDVITSYLGVEPVYINSNLVSAQNRKRIYWANFPITIPEDRGIMLLDIVHENTEIVLPEDIDNYKVALDESFIHLNKKEPKGKVGYFRKNSQANRVYYPNHKSVTLCGEAGGGAAKMGQYLFDGYVRKLTPIECERLQTLPDNYTQADTVTQTQRYKMLGNGWTSEVITHIFECMKEVK